MGFLRELGVFALLGVGVTCGFALVNVVFGPSKVTVIHKEKDQYGNIREISDPAKYGIIESNNSYRGDSSMSSYSSSSSSSSHSMVCQGEYSGWTECLSRLGAGETKCEKYYNLYNRCLERNSNM
jgi:hypothetical protein